MFRVVLIVMNTLIVTITFLGFFFLINTSKNAILNHSRLENWLQKNKRLSAYLGMLFLFIAMVISMYFKGTTSGILFAILTTLVIGSLLVIVNPLQKISYKSALLAFALFFVLELFIT